MSVCNRRSKFFFLRPFLRSEGRKVTQKEVTVHQAVISIFAFYFSYFNFTVSCAYIVQYILLTEHPFMLKKRFSYGLHVLSNLNITKNCIKRQNDVEC